MYKMTVKYKKFFEEYTYPQPIPPQELKQKILTYTSNLVKEIILVPMEETT